MCTVYRKIIRLYNKTGGGGGGGQTKIHTCTNTMPQLYCFEIDQTYNQLVPIYFT